MASCNEGLWEKNVGSQGLTVGSKTALSSAFQHKYPWVWMLFYSVPSFTLGSQKLTLPLTGSWFRGRFQGFGCAELK